MQRTNLPRAEEPMARPPKPRVVGRPVDELDAPPQHRKEVFEERTAELLARGEHLPRRVLVRRVATTFRRMCRWLAPTVAVEIGAHDALFSRQMKADLPDVRVVAYEANPYVHERFVDQVAATGVDYFHLAVGTTTGTVELSVPRDTGGRELTRTNRIASLAHNRHSHDEEKVSVPAVRLDEHLVLGPDDAAVAWIDVEGASQQVLEGSRAIVAQTGFVYIEVERAEVWEGQWLDTDVATFLDELGFVPILRDRQRRRQYNMVFAHRWLARHPWVRRQVDHVFRPAPD
jgi:FkbM family methyltransferase